MEKELTIAIPTYNRSILLNRLLSYLESELTEEVEVIVSDNASSDDTELVIKKKYPFVKYYCNERNLGPDQNFLECYKKSKGRYIWLMGSDDIITKGSIERIIDFIKKNDKMSIPVIFLNHNFFEGEYQGKAYCKEAFLKNESKDYVLSSKNEFVEFTGKQLTFMSSFLLKRQSFNKIENPEKYFGTHFIHTYLVFEATAKENIKFGVIGYPCVSQDLTPDNSEFNRDYRKLFEVFGMWMKYVLIDFAVQKGYDRNQMNSIYKKGILKKFTSWLIRIKANNDKLGMKAFWKFCFPAVKSYLYTWVIILPIAISPAFVSKFYLYFTHKQY